MNPLVTPLGASDVGNMCVSARWQWFRHQADDDIIFEVQAWNNASKQETATSKRLNSPEWTPQRRDTKDCRCRNSPPHRCRDVV